MLSLAAMMLKYSWHPPPPVMTLISVRPASSMACRAPIEVSSSRENTASIWGLAVRMSAMSFRPSSRVKAVAYSMIFTLGAISAMVSVKPFMRSSLTEPEVGTGRATTVPSVPILSTMYFAPSMPMPSLSPVTMYTPSALMAISKFTT